MRQVWDPWIGHSAGFKKELNKTVEVPGGEEWRLEYLRKLLEQRQTANTKLMIKKKRESPS